MFTLILLAKCHCSVGDDVIQCRCLSNRNRRDQPKQDQVDAKATRLKRMFIRNYSVEQVSQTVLSNMPSM